MFQKRFNHTKLEFFKSNVLVFIAILVFISAVSTLVRNLNREDRVKNARKALEELQMEQRDLLSKKEKIKKDEFLEQEARRKLGLAKPGEVVVVLPDDAVLRRLAPSLSDEGSTSPNVPIWRRWTKLFFEF